MGGSIYCAFDSKTRMKLLPASFSDKLRNRHEEPPRSGVNAFL